MAALIKERYEILELLGIGGEGRVVKALDRRHDRLVTLKIRPVRDDQAREELLSVARILLAVPPHPALPLVREDFFEGDDYGLAIGWVDGTDLATLLCERGQPGLAPSSVLAYLSQTAEALAHLHSQVPPVIHGDVKPANLILTTGGRVKLVDFGISFGAACVPSPPWNSRLPGVGARRWCPVARQRHLCVGRHRVCAADRFRAGRCAALVGGHRAGAGRAFRGRHPAGDGDRPRAPAGDLGRGGRTPAPRVGQAGRTPAPRWAEALPTGVITFCLSDIDGSPALWDAHPGAMAEALVRHDELIADCVERRGGWFLKSIGESTVSVFASAPDALAAMSLPRARCRRSSGPRIGRSRCASAFTPARPNAGAPVTSGRRSTSRPSCATRPTAGRCSSRQLRPSWSPGIFPRAANWSISAPIGCAASATRAGSRGQGARDQSPPCRDRVPISRPARVRARPPAGLHRCAAGGAGCGGDRGAGGHLRRAYVSSRARPRGRR